MADGCSLLLPAPPHDVLRGRLVAARLVAHRRLAPGRLRLAAGGRLALAAAVRMVARVHRRAAHVRAPPEPAAPARLPDLDPRVPGVAHLADRGHAGDVNAPHLARGQPQRGPVALFRHQLRAHPGAAHHLGAAARLQLHVVYDSTRGDVAEGERIARRQLGLGAGHQPLADTDPDRCDDVPLLAVLVFEQGDTRRAVGVVLDGADLRGDAELVPLPVNDTV